MRIGTVSRQIHCDVPTSASGASFRVFPCIALHHSVRGCRSEFEGIGRSKVKLIHSHGSGKVVGIRNADERQLAVLFVVVQSVAYDELIRNLKSHIVRLK